MDLGKLEGWKNFGVTE